MSEPIILLDVDGVLVEHNAEHIAILNSTFSTSYTYENCTTFNYSHMLPEHADFMRALWADTNYDDDTLSQEWLDTLTGLRSLGRLIACSSPLAGHADSKLRFLLRYFPRQDIVLASDKSIIPGTILIDDGPHNIKSFHSSSILFDRPWNRSFPHPYRATSLDILGPMTLELLESYGHSY